MRKVLLFIMSMAFVSAGSENASWEEKVKSIAADIETDPQLGLLKLQQSLEEKPLKFLYVTSMIGCAIMSDNHCNQETLDCIKAALQAHHSNDLLQPRLLAEVEVAQEMLNFICIHQSSIESNDPRLIQRMQIDFNVIVFAYYRKYLIRVGNLFWRLTNILSKVNLTSNDEFNRQIAILEGILGLWDFFLCAYQLDENIEKMTFLSSLTDRKLIADSKNKLDKCVQILKSTEQALAEIGVTGDDVPVIVLDAQNRIRWIDVKLNTPFEKMVSRLQRAPYLLLERILENGEIAVNVDYIGDCIYRCNFLLSVANAIFFRSELWQKTIMLIEFSIFAFLTFIAPDIQEVNFDAVRRTLLARHASYLILGHFFTNLFALMSQSYPETNINYAPQRNTNNLRVAYS